jgi:hypothetical protein
VGNAWLEVGKSFWRQYNSRPQVIENKAANFRFFGSAVANDKLYGSTGLG